MELAEQRVEIEDGKYFLHEVKPSDTIFGLSVQYQIGCAQIKRANDLDTDEIYFLKEVKIPLQVMSDRTCMDGVMDGVVLNVLKIQLMAGFMKTKDYGNFKMARLYLEDSNYDLEGAKQNYVDDIGLESEEQMGELCQE